MLLSVVVITVDYITVWLLGRGHKMAHKQRNLPTITHKLLIAQFLVYKKKCPHCLIFGYIKKITL